MKKTGLFKIIMFILLGMIVATWIFSASYYQDDLADIGMYNVGLFDSFQLLFGSFQFSYFIQVLIFLLVVGAFYGVLVKTGKYRELVDYVAWHFKDSELILLLIIAFVIAIMTSVFDYHLISFMFFPFLISIILAMGYDKITAGLATFGALLVGTIGSTFGNTTSGTIAGILSTKITDGIIYKFVLLALSIAVLFVFLILAKRKKNSKDVESQLFLGEKVQNKHSIWHVIIIFSILFILLVLGCTSWSDSFNVDIFDKVNTAVTSWEVKMPHFHISVDGIDAKVEKVAIFGKILGSTSAFGTWSFTEMSMMLIIASIILGLVYGFKLENTFKYMADGAKVMLRPALLVMLCYIVIYVAGNTMFVPTILSYILGISSKFRVVLSGLSMAIGSSFFVDILYIANYVIPQIASTGSNMTAITLVAQSFYGITMFIVPTSAFLALALGYLGISYKEWVKKTWLLTVSLTGISCVLCLIVTYVIK